MNEIYDYIIIGGGISGLSSLHYILKSGKSALLLEKEICLGGLVRSEKINDYLLEVGPNAFLKSYIYTYNLIKELNLENEIIYNHERASTRYLFNNNKIIPLPETPLQFIFSKLLSNKSKIRLLKEPFIGKSNNPNESLYEFGLRRFGREITENIIDPVVSGICAGDIKKIEAKALFPKLTEIENTYGSIIKFLFKYKKENTALKTSKKILFASFKNGMGTLTQKLYETYRNNISLNNEVIQIKKSLKTYEISTKQSKRFYANNLILATDAFTAGALLKQIEPKLSKLLSEIEYVNIATVSLVYEKSKINHHLNGFGFLVPRNKEFRILGTFFSSSLFDGRAPQNTHLIKTYIGGAHDKETLFWSENQLAYLVKKELTPLLGIKGEPCFVKARKIFKAIPHYTIGHTDRIIKINNEITRIGNIKLIGNYLEGVSVNVVIRLASTICKM